MRIIDLSSKIHEGMNVFPGDPCVSLHLTSAHDADAFQVTELRFGSHTGTHIDAPRHFLAGGAAITEVPLDSVVGDAVCIKAKIYYAGGELHPVIDLSEEDKSAIRTGDRVLLSTGWEEKAGTPAYFLGYPVFAKELLLFLLEKKVRMIGIDLPTVESNIDPDDTFAMHRMILSHGIIPVEGLINLSELAGKRFFFAAAPLLLENGDGSPVRAYAVMEE